MSEIDPVKFGLLIGQVKTLESQVDELQKDIKQLLALANHSKGSLWAGMMLASIFGAGVTWTINFFR